MGLGCRRACGRASGWRYGAPGAMAQSDRRRTMTEPTIREPDDIRRDAARKLRAMQVSDHFRAILGCLLGEDWTTPRLAALVITPDGHLLGRCDGEASFRAFGYLLFERSWHNVNL